MTSAINVQLNLHIWRQKLITGFEKVNWGTAASDNIKWPVSAHIRRIFKKKKGGPLFAAFRLCVILNPLCMMQHFTVCVAPQTNNQIREVVFITSQQRLKISNRREKKKKVKHLQPGNC